MKSIAKKEEGNVFRLFWLTIFETSKTVKNRVKLGYNELGYNEQILLSQMIILLRKSTRL